MVWRKISTVFLRMYYVRVKGGDKFLDFHRSETISIVFFFLVFLREYPSSLLRSLFLPFLQIFSGKIVDSCTLARGDLSFRGG